MFLKNNLINLKNYNFKKKSTFVRGAVYLQYRTTCREMCISLENF